MRVVAIICTIFGAGLAALHFYRIVFSDAEGPTTELYARGSGLALHFVLLVIVLVLSLKVHLLAQSKGDDISQMSRIRGWSMGLILALLTLSCVVALETGTFVDVIR